MTIEIMRLAASLDLAATFVSAIAWGSPASVTHGGRLAQAYCADCHAVGRQGSSPNPNAPRFRAVSAFDPSRSLDELVAEVLMKDHPPMPQFMPGPGDMDALTDYLRSIQESPPSPEPRRPDEGPLSG